jgi:Leucine-rich repeat (LRR) protein/tRNA A-37 threonylcarbamoyl transferase component Bud32
MPIATAAELLDALRRDHLLDAAQLAEAVQAQGAGDARELARELVRRGWLTPYQVNQLFRADGRPLLVGSYVLLDKLGEGGMGAVYKARNWKLGRVVAMKLIRKDRLGSDVAVKRFRREIQAAAQLHHPNIVHAYDADEAGGVHFLVMEYVEGTDLGRLLKRQGPLPVATACDYARQAALGLQHAFERGMVHRDVKPANLLLTAAGVVKVMDFGLARLGRAAAGDESSTMTEEGAVMGSLDYIAPEQAMDSHAVDARADLYSLGCTLYHLLTGRVPFPGGEALAKLLKHRLEEPAPIEQLRPDLPPGVAAVVRRLMAKRPEDRHQTPAEAADDLAAAALTCQVTTGERGADAPRSPIGDTAADWAALDTPVPGAGRAAAGDHRWLWIGAAGGVVLLLGLAALVAVLMRTTPAPAPDTAAVAAPKETGRSSAEAADGSWVKATAALPPEKQVEAVVARLKELNPGYEGQVVPGIGGGIVFSLAVPADGLATIAPLRALTGLRELALDGTPGKCRLADLSPLKGLRLTSMRGQNLQVADLSPLADMPLSTLTLAGCPVADLSPLSGLSLTSLVCVHCPVNDLAPLERLPLAGLTLQGTRVASLAPLRNMRLETLGLTSTRVTDLSPLEGMPLRSLSCDYTPVADLAPLKGMPLRQLACDLSLARLDDEILRGIATLETLNGKPAAEFFAQRDGFDAWAKSVAAMTPDEQVKAVNEELKRRNPGYEGRLENVSVESGAVAAASLPGRDLTDLSPVRALPGLKSLTLSGEAGTPIDLRPLHGLKLTALDFRGCPVRTLAPLNGLPLTQLECGHFDGDLSPLRGMRLTRLVIEKSPVKDLSPLRGMPLNVLWCSYTEVSDLAPLEKVPLHDLRCAATRVSDLTPLKSLPLEQLHCHTNAIADLSPLAGSSLHWLDLGDTRVTDLAPLKSCPLHELYFPPLPWIDVAPLRSIETLEIVNGMPPAKAFEPFDQFAAWCKGVAAMAPKDQVAAVAEELKRRNPGFDGELKSEIRGDTVVGLQMSSDDLADVSPLRALRGLQGLGMTERVEGRRKLSDLRPLHGMGLTGMNITGTLVSDLSPLRGMPLGYLRCPKTPVADLSPLRDLPLDTLDVIGTKVTDLSPLRGKHISYLALGFTAISDLSPLKGMPLTFLHCKGTRVPDLSALAGLPLKHLDCDFSPWRDTELLKSLTTLTEINDGSAADFWKKADAERADFDAWVASVAKMPAEKQAEALEDRLKRANPDWHGSVNKDIQGGAVVGVELRENAGLTDLAPVRALPGLRALTYASGPLTGLWPLHGLPLTALHLEGCPVEDLAALHGMPLARLRLLDTRVADLSPIRGMPLKLLECSHAPATDLSPLKGMRLESFDCRGLAVSDLSVLKGMPLKSLVMHLTNVTDLSFVEGMPLTGLDCMSTGVSDLSPLRGLPLTSLNCANNRVADLSPLKGLPLTGLNCGGTRVADLAPLAEMRLTSLTCSSTAVSDLSPLKDMPLTAISVRQTRVTDLSPLAGLPITDLHCDFRPERDAAVLRQMKSLATVNDKPPAEYWKAAGEKP